MKIETIDVKIEEILRKQEEIRQDIVRLDFLVKNKREEDKTHIGWEPREGEQYYFVEVKGGITRYRNDAPFDKKIIKHTRTFKTIEEAEFEVERMKVLRELEKFACDSKSYGGGYFICYDYDLHQLLTIKTTFKRHELYFESEEMAKEAIKAVGEDRVKKYYLGVKYN